MANFHRDPFDDGTKTKLASFSAYAKEWLPVFLSPLEKGSTVTIVDFFAGPGRDVNGQEGSPLLLLRTIREYSEQIQRNRIHVRLELNEGAKRKAAVLHSVMEEQAVPSDLCEWSVRNLNFEDAFADVYPKLTAGPNLLVFDQQGISRISEAVFRQLVALKRTDFYLRKRRVGILMARPMMQCLTKRLPNHCIDRARLCGTGRDRELVHGAGAHAQPPALRRKGVRGSRGHRPHRRVGERSLR